MNSYCGDLVGNADLRSLQSELIWDYKKWANAEVRSNLNAYKGEIGAGHKNNHDEHQQQQINYRSIKIAT